MNAAIPTQIKHLVRVIPEVERFNVSGQVRPDMRAQVKALLGAGISQSDLINEALKVFLDKLKDKEQA